MMKLVQLTDPETQFTFLVGEKYGVGRKAAASEGYDNAHWISFPSDQSISRLHAEITVEHPAANVRNPDLLPTLIVIDMGSKFNTYSKPQEEEERFAMNAREPCKLSNGDIVRFGRQWNEYRVSYEPLVVTGSTLKDSKKIQSTVRLLGGHFVAEWSAKCNFLLMESVTLTMKAVCALLSSAPIVTPRYFEDMIDCIRSGNPFHNNYNDYIPPFVEPSLSGLPVNLKPSGNKGALFAGKTFVYWTVKQIEKLQPAVDAGGGVSVLISDCAESVMKARDVLLFQIPKGCPVDAAAKRRLDAYQGAKKRLIGESEMSLAALHKTLDKHCNPYFDYQPKIIPAMASQTQQFVTPQPVIVPETQDEDPPSFHPGSRYVVEESINVSLRSNATPSQRETAGTGLRNTQRRGAKHVTDLDDTEAPSPKRRISDSSVASSSTTRFTALASQRSTQKSHKKSSKTLSAIFGTSDSDDDDEDIFQSSRNASPQVKEADRSAVASNSKGIGTSGHEENEDNCDIIIPATPESPKNGDAVTRTQPSQYSRSILADDLIEIQNTRGNNNLSVNTTAQPSTPMFIVPDASTSQRKRGRDLRSPGDSSPQSSTASTAKKPRGDLSSWVQVKKTNAVVKVEVEPTVTDILQKIKIEEDEKAVKLEPGCIRAPVIEKSLIKRRESCAETPVDPSWAGMKNFKSFQKVLPGARSTEDSIRNDAVPARTASLFPPIKIGRLVIPTVDGRYNWDNNSQEENIPDISIRGRTPRIATSAPNRIHSPAKSDIEVVTKPSAPTRKITRRQMQTEDASEGRSRQATQERVMMNIDSNRGKKLPPSQGVMDPSDGLFDF